MKKIPQDEIFTLKTEFEKDNREFKINGGIGIYLDNNGKPYVHPVVQKIIKKLNFDNFNYLPISGDPIFLDESTKLLLGNSLYIKKNRFISKQGVIGGTNGIYLYSSLIKNLNKKTQIIIGLPTWENHNKIFSNLNVKTKTYNHLTNKNEFNYEEIVKLLNKEQKSVVLFHGGSTHNPTGINPNPKQWEKLSKIIKNKGHEVFFDFAYMGLGYDIEKDCYPIRLFIKNNIITSIVISYSKNMTLYQHRTAALLIFNNSLKEKIYVDNYLKYIFRLVNSNPAAFGQIIVSEILKNNAYQKTWRKNLENMKKNINMRRDLFIKITNNKFAYLKNSKGFYGKLNLSKNQINILKEKYAIYLLSNSRINFGGITLKQIPLIAAAILETSI